MNNEESVRRNIGLRFAEKRLQLGLTQDALASKAGVTGGYIRQIEGGWKDMRVSTLCKLADIVHCSVKELFSIPRRKKQKPGRPRNRKSH
jgi:transcriptional regulator with XRE-family HTH domain